jgi:aerobic C4-dicarboxylate transport protein
MRGKWWQSLYLQVLVAIAAGIALGVFAPETGAAMKPVGDAFIALVKMIIGPVIFLTVVVGIAHMGDLRHVGRIGLKALIYFEVLTTVALLLGLLVVNLVQPGAGMGIDPASLDVGAVACACTRYSSPSTLLASPRSSCVRMVTYSSVWRPGCS